MLRKGKLDDQSVTLLEGRWTVVAIKGQGLTATNDELNGMKWLIRDSETFYGDLMLPIP